MRGIVRCNTINSHPFSLFNEIERDMKTLFKSPFWSNDDYASSNRSFVPACDIEDKESHLLLNVDLPGIPKEDIKIEVKNNQLTIVGERKKEFASGGYSERSYGSFHRTMSLPEGIDTEKIEANYENGVLSVAIPKSEKAKPKTIDISIGKKDGVFSKLLGNNKEDKKTVEVES